jgi:hypothetical protein
MNGQTLSNYAFIDSQNLNLAIRNQGWVLDFRKFRKYLQDKYKISRAFLFIGYMPQNQALYTGLQKKWVYFDFKPTLGIEGDVGVNANYLSHASNSVISFSLAARFTEDVFMPQNRATDAPCIPTSAPPPDIIFSSPSPPGPAGHPVSLVSVFPLIYTFPYLLPCIISLCTNVPTSPPSNFTHSPYLHHF